MKPIIIQSKIITGIATWFNGFPIWNITIWPFIFVKEPMDPISLNHERIHLRQQVELFWIGFLFLYLVFYLKSLVQSNNKYNAYRKSPFEEEAYQNHRNLDYLKTRPAYNWIKYLN